MRDDRERLLDILEAVENIERRTQSGWEAFVDDELLQVWVIHHMEIIGEAASRISQELKEKHPAVPWKDIISMRNILAHQYFGIDLNQVWDTVITDLPELRKDIEIILGEFDKNKGKEFS